jgi:hypothetical protein
MEWVSQVKRDLREFSAGVSADTASLERGAWSRLRDSYLEFALRSRGSTQIEALERAADFARRALDLQ